MKKPLLEVCLSPALLHLYNLEDAVLVVIDIFRASSTMVAALDNGAKEIIPVATVAECIELGNEVKDSITAGERDGFIADGLEYGNSPLTFSKEFIANKSLILTTTNGTRLLHMSSAAKEIIIGAFSNLSTVIDYLRHQNTHIILACASWKDRVNMEDSLFAGAVADALQNDFDLNCDSANMCRLLWSQAKDNLLDFLKPSNHYKRLSSRGLELDLEYCTRIDNHPSVPKYEGRVLLKA